MNHQIEQSFGLCLKPMLFDFCHFSSHSDDPCSVLDAIVCLPHIVTVSAKSVLLLTGRAKASSTCSSSPWSDDVRMRKWPGQRLTLYGVIEYRADGKPRHAPIGGIATPNRSFVQSPIVAATAQSLFSPSGV
jgi:hypothetical protein